MTAFQAVDEGSAPSTRSIARIGLAHPHREWTRLRVELAKESAT